MTLFNRKQVVTLAFNTEDPHNRLNESQKLALVLKFTEVFHGATLTENIGGYMMDNGTPAIEYSYTFTLLKARKSVLLPLVTNIASDNDQESFLVNGKLYYTKELA